MGESRPALPMREGDAAFEALRAAIDELAAGEAAGLIAEARIEARAKVRSILAEAIAQALLEHSSEVLSEEGVEVPGAPAAGSPAAPLPPAEAENESEAEPTAAAKGEREPHGLDRASAPPEPRLDAAQAASEDLVVPASPETEGALGWYVYCVVAADRFTPPGRLDGVDPAHAVTQIARAGVAALASPVSLAEFGEERLRENLNDVGWLEATARTHEQVLEVALAETTVIPMRLCTVYASEESVGEMLDRERPVFVDAMARLEGRTEWGVKVFVDRSVLEQAAAERSDELAVLRAEVDALPEGEAYMKRKHLDELATEEADLLADACVDDVHGRLSARATEALLNPLQRSGVSGHSGEMLLNGVYLVEDQTAAAFHAVVAELSEGHSALGFAVELTGPWPPYNFIGSSIEAAR